MSLPLNIKHLRKLAKLTQMDVGKAAGISQVTVGRYETGDRVPTTVELSAISALFGVTMEMLVEGDMAAMFPTKEAYDTWRADAEDRYEREEEALEKLRYSPYKLEALVKHYAQHMEKEHGTPVKKTLSEIERLMRRILDGEE